MGRIARIVGPGLPHHITQGGNRRMDTFFCDDDYRAYLHPLVEWTRRHEVGIWAYCRMPNHVHLVVVPMTADGLCRSLGEAHRRHTRRINFRENWRGHLWQGRFALYVMDEAYLMAATRFVEPNPAKANLSERAEDWPWSSAAAHRRLWRRRCRVRLAGGADNRLGLPVGRISAGTRRSCVGRPVATTGKHWPTSGRAGVPETPERAPRPRPAAQKTRPKAKSAEVGMVSHDIPSEK
jgi:REP element-mobilizing transposase RayT